MASEAMLREKIRTNLLAWATYALTARGQSPARHHVVMLRALENLALSDNRQLMLLMPPGSAKSTYASLLFPAWWMARKPGLSVITASHTARLAESFGQGVRSLLIEHASRLGVFLCRNARASGQFRTGGGGEYFAIGVGGAVTGRRADLALLDDPIASLIDAESSVARDRLWNWYRAELVTRLKPNAKTILVMARWHEDDLAGRLLQKGGWEVLRFPALAEDCDPLDRGPGDALWPEWEDRDALLAKQETLGQRCFAALFQQSPLPLAGQLFKLSKLRIFDNVPEGMSVRAWDLAAAIDPGSDPDWTVGVRLLKDQNGIFFVEDVFRARVSPAELNTAMREVADRDGPSVIVGLPRDPGQAGLYQVALLTRALTGYRVLSSPEVGSKSVRAYPVASQIEAGNLHLKRGSWNDAFLDELSVFPSGRKDDQVDALARGFQILISAPTPTHYDSVSFIGR